MTVQRSAAVKLQTVFRTQRMQAEYKTSGDAVKMVQRLCRGRAVREQMTVQRSAAVKLQTVFRTHNMQQQYHSHLNNVAALRQRSCVQIQRVVRGRSTRLSVVLIKAQLLFEKQQFQHQNQAAKTVQQFFTQVWAVRKQQTAASRIQCVSRVFIGRQRRSKLLSGVSSLQKLFRGVQVRKRSKKEVRAALQRVRVCNESAQECMKLGNRTASALQMLLNSSKLAVVMHACQNLGKFIDLKGGVVMLILCICCSCGHALVRSLLPEFGYTA
jgi:hypothetical protein